jgi:pyruvate-ferredoxin/flavodoxin oxidoreductase
VPRRAFVAQSSCGAPGHLAAAVGEALSCDGPGLVRIHAPSPERHGFAAGATVTRAATAVASRVWPLFTSSPAVAGEPRHLSLAGNPSPTRDWSGATPAEWATGERRFAGHFAPGGGGEQVLALADYLALPAGERAGKVPAITRCAAPAAAGGEGGGTGEGPGPVLHISAELARAAEDRLGAWRTLRGMALELEAEEMVAVAELEAQRRRHQTEMAAAQAGYEERLAGLQWQVQVETARRLRDRLLQLASRRPPPEVAQPAAAPPPAGGPNGHDLPGAEPEG